MKGKTLCKTIACLLAAGLLWGGTPQAQEVNKGEIPAAHLETSFKALPWGSPVWDESEAIEALKGGGKQIWVDTRPASFFEKGTVSGAIHLEYDKGGSPDNTLTAESLTAAIAEKGGSKEDTTVVLFCQGPTCHRSYNAAYVAVKEWGFDAGRIVWFRAGYPLLLKAVKEDPKLSRKAKTFISEAGLKEL